TALWQRGREDQDPHLLEEVGRSFPVALVAPQALLSLGQLYQEKKRPADAARAFKRLVAEAPDDALRARALLGLARAYEAQRLWAPARAPYAQALARFPDPRLEEAGAGVTLASVVPGRLAEKPFDRLAADRVAPALPVPLALRWRRRWDDPARPL